MRLPTTLLVATLFLTAGLGLLPGAAAHGCVSGLAGPPCSAPFCPDNGQPHLHLAPEGLVHSMCLWSVGIGLLP